MTYRSIPALAILGLLIGAAPQDSETPELLRATLIKDDFLRQTVSLDDGLPGKVLQGRQVFNRDSDLDFGNYDAGFSVGIQGGDNGKIIDLGHWRDLANRYGYDETVGGGQGFNSIRFEHGGLVILDDLSKQLTQPFTEGNDFIAQDPPSSSSAPATVGHIYLIRIVDRNRPQEEHIAKFLVTETQGDQSATIIWENLDRTPFCAR